MPYENWIMQYTKELLSTEGLPGRLDLQLNSEMQMSQISSTPDVWLKEPNT